MDSTMLGLILFIVLVIGWPVGRVLFHSREFRRWIDFVDALRQYDSKTFEDLGSPTFNFLQFGKKPFANSRLWFEVLRNRGRFHTHLRIREAAEA